MSFHDFLYMLFQSYAMVSFNLDIDAFAILNYGIFQFRYKFLFSDVLKDEQNVFRK